MNNNKNKFSFPEFIKKIFNKSNLNKILIIFIVGLTTRISINYIYNINVFVDYFNKISIIYYVSMSMFTVFIHEVITHFNINIIPTYLFDSCDYIKKLIFNLVNLVIYAFNTIKSISTKIFGNLSLRDFSIFSIKNLIKDNPFFNNSIKLSLTNNELDSSYTKKVYSTLNSNILSKNSSGESHGNTSPSSSNNHSNTSSRWEHRRNNNNRGVHIYRNNPIVESREHNNQNNMSSSSSDQNDRENRLSANELDRRRLQAWFELEGVTCAASDRYANGEISLRELGAYYDNQYSNNNYNNESYASTPQRANTPISYPYNPDSPIPQMPNAPNTYANLSTPSSTAPTFRTHESIPSDSLTNNKPVETSQRQAGYAPDTIYSRSISNLVYRPFDISRYTVNSNYSNRPITSVDNSDNRYSTNGVGSSYRDSYRLPATTYSPATNISTSNYVPATNYVPTSYSPSYIEPRSVGSPQSVSQPIVSPQNTDQPIVSPQSTDQPASSFSYASMPSPYELAATYFPENNDSNQNTRRALIDNPRPRPSYVSTNDTNWNQLRNHVQYNIAQELRGYSSKEVLVPVEKKGILGKMKLGFKYLDNKMHNLDTVYVTFRDKSRRKFVWTLWEKSSGNYESYQDFKSTWNPKTSIWNEIKNRTHKDMRMDIENILGVTKNTRTLGNVTTNTIKPAPSKTIGEVRNLVRSNVGLKEAGNHNPESSNTRSSTRTKPINSDNIVEDVQSNRKHRHKHKHKDGHSSRSHGHSSRSHDHSSRSHGHSRRGHGHSSSNHPHSSHGHSSRSHGHSSRRHGHDNSDTRNRHYRDTE